MSNSILLLSFNPFDESLDLSTWYESWFIISEWTNFTLTFFLYFLILLNIFPTVLFSDSKLKISFSKKSFSIQNLNTLKASFKDK